MSKEMDKCKWSLGTSTDYELHATRLMLSISYSGVFSTEFLQFIYNHLWGCLMCLANKDKNEAQRLYKSVCDFLDMTTIFTGKLKSDIKAPFVNIITSIKTN